MGSYTPTGSDTRSRRDRGFTLIELMITVGIIGLLAAVAIPNFISYQARSRRSEAFVNLASLARAYKAYHAEEGVFPDTDFEAPFEPTLPNWTLYGTGDLSTYKMPWDSDTQTFFDLVGWRVEGKVFYSYDANTVSCGCGPDGDQCFTLTAYGDVDADGAKSAVMYVHPQRDPATGVVVNECGSGLFGWSAPLEGGSAVYDQVAVQATTDNY